jgi:hypothetical protein
VEGAANLPFVKRMGNDTQKPNGANGVGKILSTLAGSSNAWIQFGTLAMIGLSGFGNWVATWNSADRNKTEIEVSRRVALEGEQRIKLEVIRQVDEIHSWIQNSNAEFHQGNADTAQNKKILLALKDEVAGFEKRQEQMLETQGAILRELKKGTSPP